jgi:hypothetical protein
MPVQPETCRVDWQAFGLEPPAPEGCARPSAFGIVQACVHEHVQEALPCAGCLAYMRSLEPLDRWGCAPCLLAKPSHQCTAPVIVTALARETSCAA